MPSFRRATSIGKQNECFVHEKLIGWAEKTKLNVRKIKKVEKLGLKIEFYSMVGGGASHDKKVPKIYGSGFIF